MKRGLFANYIGFAARYLISFISLPFLSRVLTPAGFGGYVMALSVATMIGLVVEYGYGVSGLREVSLATTLAERMNVLGRVTLAKIALIAICIPAFAIYAASPFHADFAGINSGLVLALGISQGLNLGWYFQGTARSSTAASIDGLTQLTWVVGAICLVHSRSDVGTVIALQAASTVTAACIAHKIALRQVPDWSAALRRIPTELRSGFTFFVLRLGTAGFTTISSLLVGTLAGPAEAGFYNAAERLIGTIIAAFTPASQVLMPHVVKSFAHAGEEAMFRSSRRIGAVLLGLSLLTLVGIWFTAPIVIHLLSGAKFERSVGVLRILAFALPCVAVSQALGVYLAVPLRKDKSFTASVLLAGATSVALAAVLAPRFGADGMAFCRVAAEATLGLGLAVGLTRTGHIRRLIRPSLVSEQCP